MTKKYPSNQVLEPQANIESIETRGYQQEMLDESLRQNIIIAMDTGSGKTHIAVLRLKHESERELTKLSWFLAPTVALCEQQCNVIKEALPVSVGLISGALAPDQWKDANLWKSVLSTHRVMVSTPQVLLDALRHGYIVMSIDIGLIIFDEAHHAVDNDPYNRIMQEFYHKIPPGDPSLAHIASSQVRSRRPMIMGLTASPIFGGNVDKAFQTIERNLDSKIVSPRRNRSEFEGFVHRPVFKHIMYDSVDVMNPPFCANFTALQDIQSAIQIENDPYIKALRNQLSRIAPGSPEYHRTDQKLSKAVANEGTFTHKGLRDFTRTASEILYDVGVWAASWYIWEVLEQAKKAISSERLMPSWQSEEKMYLLSIINQINVAPVSYDPDDIIDGQSDKVTALLQCLLSEKEDAEIENDRFSGLVFVQRRDVVLALAELLKHHPVTTGSFQVGPLLGASDSSHRHAFLDITRRFLKQSQDETLVDFKLGDKNLLISTSVAEEGIDVQACGCVIRWDLPPNMASWAQSRGRARQKRSTFIMMFQSGSLNIEDVMKWQKLEAEMVARYMDPNRAPIIEDSTANNDDEDEDLAPICVESTGASVSLQSAIPHLNHFCAVMPHRGHFVYQPLYDLDPPDFPIGWHSFDNRSAQKYTGPWSATVTLPRVLPQELRVFTTLRIYPTKVSAYRHAAFETYKALYNARLLNDNLLPLVDEADPEIEKLKQEVEKRTGMTNVSLQMDPWAPEEEEEAEIWFASKLMIGSLPPIEVLTRRPAPLWTSDDDIKLYHPSMSTLELRMEPIGKLVGSDERIAEAQEYTRMLFWTINGSRMKWDDLDFPYLVRCPIESSSPQWNTRRMWMQNRTGNSSPANFIAPSLDFGGEFNYPNDIGIVYKGFKAFSFVRWRWDQLSEEEEAKVLELHSHSTDLRIQYPLLEVRPFHPRTNFLVPRPSGPSAPLPSFFLLPQDSSIALISQSETCYAFLLPSILRELALHLSMDSLRSNLFTDRSPLSMIPNSLLITALCAPVSGEPKNYQRLETLGDTVLKFIVSLQLLGEYPLWLEGYLSRKKDHAVSNVRLAKENVTRELYKWIIRDRLLGKKWKPLYISAQQINASMRGSFEPETVEKSQADTMVVESQTNERQDVDMESCDHSMSPAEVSKDRGVEKKELTERPNKGKGKQKTKKKKNSQQLSTKVLADVVESLIGAAYIHGGIPLGYECTKFFQLNINSWQPLPNRISSILERSDASYSTLLSTSSLEDGVQFPPQFYNVEKIIGYTFLRPMLLLEALTHPSCQEDHGTISYERMEFLGDAVLDMIVTDFLYHARGKEGNAKEYSPGHIFLRKSAMVNSHILAFVCLRSKVEVEVKMPKAYAMSDVGGEPGSGNKKQRYRGEQRIVLEEEKHTVHLYKCLLHSSPRILEDQHLTHARFVKRESEILHALEEQMFPWASLTRMQAPKFFSDMIESILGAVYLDCEGNLDVVKEVMRSLGLYQILEMMVREDMDVLHPVSRLALWASKQKPEAKKIEYDFRKEKGRVSCGILVDGVELEGSRVDDLERGKASQEEVRFAAAEEAIRKLNLRDVGVGYELLKKKSKAKRKGKDTATENNAAFKYEDTTMTDQ